MKLTSLIDINHNREKVAEEVIDAIVRLAKAKGMKPHQDFNIKIKVEEIEKYD